MMTFNLGAIRGEIRPIGCLFARLFATPIRSEDPRHSSRIPSSSDGTHPCSRGGGAVHIGGQP